MSHIFDALQRSEAEANGAEMPETRKSTLPHATELLQLAERKMRAQNAASATRRERDQADRAQPDRIGADRAKVDHEDPDRAEMDGAALDRFADLPEFDREPSDVAATRRREGDLRESMRREPEVREPEVREPEVRETDRRDLGRRELGRPELDRRELERPSIASSSFLPFQFRSRPAAGWYRWVRKKAWARRNSAFWRCVCGRCGKAVR